MPSPAAPLRLPILLAIALLAPGAAGGVQEAKPTNESAALFRGGMRLADPVRIPNLHVCVTGREGSQP